ncbi:uncharacterized protein LOC119262030 [Tachysurus ichikawai]
MTRNTVVNKVTKASVEMKRKLKAALSEIEFIATTTDCWTAHCRGFIGVTAHWFNPQTMQRSCAALACKQLEGSHTFSALAGALNDIHTEFNIREKIVRSTTDNGSNFLKAFRVYGQTDENNNPEPVGEGDGEENKLRGFTPVELAFLAEYAKTMSPVAKALDVLQGETSVQMGWSVPTITLLWTKLQHLHVTSKFCEPLIAALLSGLEKRFGVMLADPVLIAAAILVPKFKTCWKSDENILKLGLDYIRNHLDCQAENHISEGSQLSEEEDFFSSLKKTSPLEMTQQLRHSRAYW